MLTNKVIIIEQHSNTKNNKLTNKVIIIEHLSNTKILLVKIHRDPYEVVSSVLKQTT
jgi:hypothetical protein